MQLKMLQKKAIQKIAQGTGDLIGNKIADKITKVSKKNISPEKSQKFIDDLRLT